MTPRCHAVFTDRATHDPSHIGQANSSPSAPQRPPVATIGYRRPQPFSQHQSHHGRQGGERPEHSRSFWIAAFSIPIVALLSAIVWLSVSTQLATRADERTIRAIHTSVSAGMPRAAAYVWLREHGLVAVNPAYAAWSRTVLGAWYRSDDGAWPEVGERRAVQPMALPINPANPEVEIRLTSAAHGGCTATIAQLLFDRFDRVKHIAYSQPYWRCQ